VESRNSARGRCDIHAYRSAGDEQSAELELKAARSTFERLGAAPDALLCDELLRAGAVPGTGRRVTRTFMFTDIVGSTNLLEAMGDEAWEAVLAWHDDALRTLIERHGGQVVQTTGDGFFAAFEAASAAAECAVAIQRRLAEHRHEHGFAPQVRIGLHAAEATVLADDYAGLGVHTAARVGAAAGASEILATVDTLVDVETTPADERVVTLKGLATPIRVASVEWRPASGA
jgi:class 3 adenylate cyclase